MKQVSEIVSAPTRLWTVVSLNGEIVSAATSREPARTMCRTLNGRRKKALYRVRSYTADNNKG